MPTVPPPAKLQSEAVIPDCCNVGVLVRSLLAVNGLFLAEALLRANGLMAGLGEFAELSIFLEPACLSSLLALCGLRNIVRAIPPWVQRLACAVVPAVVTGLLIKLFLSSPIIQEIFPHRAIFEGMLLAALLGFLLQHYFEMRMRAFSPALAEARLQALQARIRPHFLFNSLNAVLSLIRTEPKRAETTLEDLADLFRVLMRDARDIASLDDEICICRQYLSIEKIRLGERLQVEWNTSGISDEVLRKAQIPALLLQPLLENAVHYGVEPANAPVLIQVRISRSMDRIEVEVINPVPGTGPLDGNGRVSLGNHMALDNIRQRLNLLHDIEARLETKLTNGFFEVRLYFPYVRAEL
jgi:two-component system sensor histidine kinase AlgZ